MKNGAVLMMFVYVVTASASAICAASRISRSPFFGFLLWLWPFFFACASDGASAPIALPPATTPAPLTAARARNWRRSVPPSNASADIWLSLRLSSVTCYAPAARADHWPSRESDRDLRAEPDRGGGPAAV